VKKYPEKVALGKRIRSLREERKMTQMDLAVAASISEPSYISRIESGVTNPTFTLLVDIAKAFGISLKELMPD
jgi:Predicted transcriptional regulators